MLPRTGGQPVVVYRVGTSTDSDGNESTVPVQADPHRVTAAVYQPAAAVVDSPGAQVMADEWAANVTPNLPGVAAHSVVEWDGRWWDVKTEPEYHHHALPSLRHDTLRLSLRASGAPAGW